MVTTAWCVSVFAQNNWVAEPSKNNRFVENLGQFDEFENDYTGKIHYAIDFGFSTLPLVLASPA